MHLLQQLYLNVSFAPLSRIYIKWSNNMINKLCYIHQWPQYPTRQLIQALCTSILQLTTPQLFILVLCRINTPCSGAAVSQTVPLIFKVAS